MSLHRLNGWLSLRLTKYAARAAFLQSQLGQIPSWQHRYLTESLISDIWLSWCWFSRILIHKSLRGTKARDNTVINGRTGDNSWQYIGHQCSKAALAQNHLGPAPSGFLMRREPTWGDIGALIKIVTALTPANKNQLLTALGLPFSGPKHIQIVRNCAAHKTIENLNFLRGQFILTYDISGAATPEEVVWANKLGSSDLAIDLWLHEMRIMGEVATASV
jgi:hypothetical protein